MAVELYPPKGDDFLSLDELKVLTPEIVIERCRALKQPLRDHAAQAERQRRPVDHLWDAIRRTGFFYMSIPKKYGGLEASPDQVIDASLELTGGCGSTGWIACFAQLHNRLLVDYPVQFQDEVFGGGKFTIWAGAAMPLGTAVSVDGGYRVSGRFKWATCITQAEYVGVLCVFDVPTGKRGGQVMIPVRDGTVIDTWRTDGLCATGTHDFEVKDVFVPEHRANLAGMMDGTGPGSKLYDNPIYHMPLRPLLTSTTTTIMIGIAKSAVELYHERLRDHAKRGTDMRESEKQASQIRLAKADTMISTAEALLRDVVRENLGTPLRGDAQIPFTTRLRAKLALAIQMCRQAVLMICELTGTSIHYLDNPLQRILRDTMVGTSHITFDHDVTFEQHARGMLGLPPTTVII